MNKSQEKLSNSATNSPDSTLDNEKSQGLLYNNTSPAFRTAYTILVNQIVGAIASEFNQQYKLSVIREKMNKALAPLGIQYNTKQRFFQIVEKYGKEVRE